MRRLAVFTAGFAAGCLLAQYLLPEGWLLIAGWLCLLLAIGARWLPRDHRRRAAAVLAACALALGYRWLYVRQIQRPLSSLSGTEGRVEMTLCGYAVPADYGAKVTVKLKDFPIGKAEFYGDDALLALSPGQTVTADVRFRDAGKILDTTVTTYVSKGVFVLAYGQGEAVCGPGTSSSIRWWPQRAGRAVQEQIASLFSGDEGGFLTAILTGERSGLSEQALTDLSESGLYHIMAVSGIHCGFLLSLVILLTGGRRRRWTAGIAIPLLSFYALLAGGRPSVVRACVMLSLLLAAPLFYRDSDPPTSLAAALLSILLADPFAIASVSLQLSFAAVAGLLWLTPKVQRGLLGEGEHGRAVRFLAASFSATMGALVFTLPLSACYFGRLVLISPLSNLLCLWAAGGIFVLGLVSVLASFLWRPLGALLALAPRILIRYVLLTARLLAKLPYHALYFTEPYLRYWLAFAYVLFAAAYLSRTRGRRIWALASVLAAVSLAATVYLGRLRYRNDLDAVILDVGQGQSVILASGGRYALVDCGSGNGWRSAGETAADQLSAMGCRRLDYLILTHYDWDHVSGVTGLLARMEVDRLLVPEQRDDTGIREAVLAPAAAHGVEVSFPEELREIPLGRAVLTVYPPLGEDGGNDRGLSVLASAGEEDLLITGDMSGKTEWTLLATYPLPDIEVLVAGHHGAGTSTSSALLRALRPELACVSVGENRYGHPAEETLARLARQGCAVYRTDELGSVHLSMNGGDRHGEAEG